VWVEQAAADVLEVPSASIDLQLYWSAQVKH
jgi:hypothetical protein